MVRFTQRQAVHNCAERLVQPRPAADALQRLLFDEMCSLTTPVTTSRVSQNEGYMRHSGRRLKKDKNPLLTSHIAISTNIVLSIR